MSAVETSSEIAWCH